MSERVKRAQIEGTYITNTRSKNKKHCFLNCAPAFWMLQLIFFRLCVVLIKDVLSFISFSRNCRFINALFAISWSPITFVILLLHCSAFFSLYVYLNDLTVNN